MNDLDIAVICNALYTDQEPGYWTRLWPHDCGMAAMKRVHDKFDVVVWRGSTTLDDWLADLNAWPIWNNTLGLVHPGFLRAVLDLQKDILKAVARPAIITGHSLGAGHALLHAGFLTAAKKDLVRVTTFGTPRPGCAQLAKILTYVAGNDYKNRNDPVTGLPAMFGYQHRKPLIRVDVEPSLSDGWGLLADHHMSLYLTAMEAKFQPTAY